MSQVTPQMDRDNYTKMLSAVKAYYRAGGLVKMTREQLENMPKEVMIGLAPNEIAPVWDKLPIHMQTDVDMVKYQFCTEHYNSTNVNDDDEGDGPIPRKLFCCYCKIGDVNVTTENSIKTQEEGKSCISLNPFNCCKQQ